MPSPQSLEASTQLLVEGNDQRNFFEAFVRHLGVSGVQVQNFGGVYDLSEFIMNMSGMDEFSDHVRSLGIVRDAEASAQEAFRSVQGSLRRIGLTAPDRPRQRVGVSPSVSVLILSDDDSPGMLETLLCRTFSGSGLDGCIDSFFECVHAELGHGPHRPHKARAHAYIATQRDAHVSVGVAAQRNYWDLNHAVFDGVRDFLRGCLRSVKVGSL